MQLLVLLDAGKSEVARTPSAPPRSRSAPTALVIFAHRSRRRGTCSLPLSAATSRQSHRRTARRQDGRARARAPYALTCPERSVSVLALQEQIEAAEQPTRPHPMLAAPIFQHPALTAVDSHLDRILGPAGLDLRDGGVKEGSDIVRGGWTQEPEVVTMGCRRSGADPGSSAGPGARFGQPGIRRRMGGEVPGSSSSPAYSALRRKGTSQEWVAPHDPQ